MAAYQALASLLVLLGIEVACLEALLEVWQSDAVTHIHWVNHVPKALAHLAPMRVTHNRVQVHLLSASRNHVIFSMDYTHTHSLIRPCQLVVEFEVP